MNALRVALNDLRVLSRDRGAVITLLLVPVVLMVVASTALSGVFGGGADRVTIHVADEDGSAITRGLLASLAGSDSLTLDTSHSAAQLRQRVAQGDLGAGLIFPAGFGAAVQADQPARIEVLKYVSSQVTANVTEQIAAN